MAENPMSTPEERRRFLRCPIRVKMELQVADDAAGIRSQTGDLSEGGLHFFWMRALAKGTPLRIVLPVLDHLFKLSGQVVYSIRDTVTGLFRTGVAFREPSSLFRMKLAEEILRIQKFRDELVKKRNENISVEDAARQWIQMYSKEFAKIYQ